MKKSSFLPRITFGIMGILFGILFVYFLILAIYYLHNEEKLTIQIGICILNSFLAALLATLISAVSTYLKNLLQKRKHTRKLWRLPHPQKSTICLAAHKWDQVLHNPPGKRTRYGVGEGQIQALPYIMTSLHHAYGDDYSWNNIYQAHSCHADYAYDNNHNLILIGGPLTNPLTEQIIKDVSTRVQISPFTTEGVTITIPSRHIISPHTVKRKHYKVNGIYPATTDYALILHVTQGDISTRRKVVLIAGCNTNSTGAAAYHFCNRLQTDEKWQNIDGKDYVAIIECQYDYMHPNGNHNEFHVQTELIFIQAI